jgi:hypothetical protein
LLDATVSVAATGAGLSITRFFIVHSNIYIYGSQPFGPLGDQFARDSYRYTVSSSFMLLSWCLALLALRFRVVS